MRRARFADGATYAQVESEVDSGMVRRARFADGATYGPGGSAYSRARGSGAAAELAAAGRRWEVMHIVVEKCCKKKSGVYKSSV